LSNNFEEQNHWVMTPVCGRMDYSDSIWMLFINPAGYVQGGPGSFVFIFTFLHSSRATLVNFRQT
jgi:hypothetical protein